MRSIFFKHLVLLAGAVFTTCASAQSQPTSRDVSARTADVAVLFSLERTQIAEPNGERFWLKGGGGDLSFKLWHGLGIAGDINVEQGVSSVSSFDKISYMAGPRYTWALLPHSGGFAAAHPSRLYAESLFGGVHGFNSLFPTGTNGLANTADGLSLFFGGGIDTTIHSGFGVRIIEVGLAHTNLPNNAADSQNDLRLGFGLSYRR